MVSSDQRVKGGISLVHQTYYLVHRGVMDFFCVYYWSNLSSQAMGFDNRAYSADFFGEPFHAIIRLFAQTIICCCALSPRLEAFAE